MAGGDHSTDRLKAGHQAASPCSFMCGYVRICALFRRKKGSGFPGFFGWVVSKFKLVGSSTYLTSMDSRGQREKGQSPELADQETALLCARPRQTVSNRLSSRVPGRSNQVRPSNETQYEKIRKSTKITVITPIEPGGYSHWSH